MIPPQAIPIGLSLLSFLSGSQKSKTSQTSTTTPTGDPAYGPLQQALIAQAMSRINNPSALPAGYEAQGVGKINDTFGVINQGIGNRAAAQGVSGGPTEAYARNISDLNRGGQIAGFRTGLPLLERGMRMEDLGFAANVLGSQRYGSTTNTTSTGGGGLGGGLSNAAGILGFLYGQGALGGGSKGGTSAGGSDWLSQLLQGGGTPSNAVPW